MPSHNFTGSASEKIPAVVARCGRVDHTQRHCRAAHVSQIKGKPDSENDVCFTKINEIRRIEVLLIYCRLTTLIYILVSTYYFQLVFKPHGVCVLGSSCTDYKNPTLQESDYNNPAPERRSRKKAVAFHSSLNRTLN